MKLLIALCLDAEDSTNQTVTVNNDGKLITLSAEAAQAHVDVPAADMVIMSQEGFNAEVRRTSLVLTGQPADNPIA